MTAATCAYVQQASTSADVNGSNQVTLVINGVAPGNLLLVGAFWKGAVTIAITDDKGGAYVDSGNGVLTRPTDGFLQVLAAPNSAGGNVTLTFTFSGAPTAGNNRLSVFEYSGANVGVYPFEGTNATGTSTSGTHSVTASFTPLATDGFVFYWEVNDHSGNAAPDSGYTERLESGAGRTAGDWIFNGGSPGAITAGVTTDSAVTKAGIIACVVRAQRDFGVATDNFNRANGGLGSSWVTCLGHTAQVINGNQIEAQADPCADLYLGFFPAGTNMYAKATIKVLPGGTSDDQLLMTRCNLSSWYMGGSEGTISAIYLVTNSGTTFTLLATGGTGYSVNDVVEFHSVGSKHTLFKNGVEILSVTDTTLLVGYCGVWQSTGPANPAMDDFECGDLPFVQSISHDTLIGDTRPITMSGVRPNSTLVAHLRLSNTTDTPTASDDVNGAWPAAVKSQVQTTDGHKTWLFILPKSAAGSPTVDFSGVTTVLRWTLVEQAIGVLGSTLDQTASAQADGTGSPDSGNVTTTHADEVLLGGFSSGTSASWTAGTNFVNRAAAAIKEMIEDRVVHATGTYSAGATVPGDNCTAMIATLYAAAPASGFDASQFPIIQTVRPRNSLRVVPSGLTPPDRIVNRLLQIRQRLLLPRPDRFTLKRTPSNAILHRRSPHAGRHEPDGYRARVRGRGHRQNPPARDRLRRDPGRHRYALRRAAAHGRRRRGHGDE